jgi:hypothetical protein
LKQGFDKLSPNGLKGIRTSMVFPFALSRSKGACFKLTHYPRNAVLVTAPPPL